MSVSSVGDLARTFQNIRRNTQLKTEMARLSKELASGQISDLASSTSGDFGPLVGLERGLRTNAAYHTSNAEAGLFAVAMQTALETVQETTADLGVSLLEAGTLENAAMIETTTTDARVKFEAVVSSFNTRAADRYAFSGAATDRRPLADANVILAALDAAAAGQTTAAGIEAMVEAWFDDPGGGFETGGYVGSASPMSPFLLSESDTVEMDITAADQEIRDVLKGIALAALLGENILPGDATERSALARAAGQKMVNSESTLAVLRSKVGSAEARIDGTSAKNIAEKLSLEIAMGALTAIDPFQVATELESVNLQLETLYTLTVRMSRLSLTVYL